MNKGAITLTILFIMIILHLFLFAVFFGIPEMYLSMVFIIIYSVLLKLLIVFNVQVIK
jgi:hypothetical protein